jgi:alpha-L-fucosidase 2
LTTGITFAGFDVDGNHIREEVFASAPADLIVLNIRADKPFSASVRLSREKDASVSYDNDGQIFLQGQIIDQPDPLAGPGGKHMRFAAVCKVLAADGKVVKTDGALQLDNVSDVTLLITGATDYVLEKLNTDPGRDPLRICRQIVKKSENKKFAGLKKDHIKEYTAMFGRVDFELGKDTLGCLPTDERLQRVKSGMVDNGLTVLYFQYGRYLLMGSSRKPGRLPANLQGIWNDKFKAPWNSDFHTNINLQMNYWPAEVCNLSECTPVLTDFMKALTGPGSVTAKKMYGTEGWTLHHLTDPYGRTGVADGVWGITPMNGPWMTFPLYRHYDFTRDTDYLKSVYPLLKGSAQFVLGFLVRSPEGFLVTNPSHSPENSFYIPGTDKKSMLCYGATIDTEIINGLFDRCIKAAEILGRDKEFADSLKAVKSQLPPIKIGADGTIQEWIEDFREVEPGHRHMSHLVALYPLMQISPDTPALWEAARKTIEKRLANGGGHTGWSRAWVVNFFARLHDGENAFYHLQKLFEKSTLSNLFDTHPPFQIDGNFGGTAGIAEMLLQSNGDVIYLLPALPSEWPEGKISGLKARGNYEVDMEWKNGKLVHAVISSPAGGDVTVKYGEKQYEAHIVPGGTFVVE